MKLISTVKIWISTGSGEGAFSSGKYRLLKAIGECGSLASAADRLKISYRNAWGALKKADKNRGKEWIIKHQAGSHGGQTVLTEEKIGLISAYSKFIDDVNPLTTQAYKKQMEPIFHEGP